MPTSIKNLLKTGEGEWNCIINVKARKLPGSILPLVTRARLLGKRRHDSESWWNPTTHHSQFWGAWNVSLNQECEQNWDIVVYFPKGSRDWARGRETRASRPPQRSFRIPRPLSHQPTLLQHSVKAILGWLQVLRCPQIRNSTNKVDGFLTSIS